MILYSFDSMIGRIQIAEENDKITRLFFMQDLLPEEHATEGTPLLKEAARQIKLYLQGKLMQFDLPLAPSGTPFMRKVWKALLEIPYGDTCTYKDLAEKVGSPKSARAVGLANNKNPLPIFIPCHRVIGKNGTLTGYRGGLELKKKLLSLEQTLR